MKRLFFFLLAMVAFIVPTYAQEAAPKTDTPPPVEVTLSAPADLSVTQLMDKYFGQISEAISNAGTPIKHLYELAVKQVQLEAVQRVFISGSILLVCTILVIIGFYKVKHTKLKPDDNPWEVVAVIFTVAGVISLIVTLTTSMKLYMVTHNPEWYAVKELIEQAQTLVN